MKDILLVGINSKYIHPSMGIFSIYANSMHKCDYIEFTIKDDYNKILSYLLQDKYDVICISTYIWNIEIVKRLLNDLKSKTVVLGGPEASFSPFLVSPNVYVIKGEGENSFNELINYFKGNISIDKVSNLYYFKDKICYTYDLLPDINNIKHDLSLIKDFTNRISYIESSRGCYFSCTYCLASKEKPVRFFPLDEVKNNLLYLLNNNAKVIKFLDRSFNINREYTKEILKFIKLHDNNISKIQFEIVGDNFDDELIEIIKSLRKKMIRFEIGIQSTNAKTLEAIKRKQNMKQLFDNINKIKEYVIIHTDLIAGLPYEDFNRFKISFNDTFRLFTEELQLGFLKELKGTEISNTSSLYGYVFDDTAPYEVVRNNYISSYELDIIRKVESGVDILYNKGHFKRLIHYLFVELNLDPFDTLYYVMKNFNKSLQFDMLCKYIYDKLCDIVSDNDYLLFVMKKDYLTRTKIKPKLFYKYDIDKKTRFEIYNYVSNKCNISINDLYSYCHLEMYKNNIFIVNYKKNETIEITM